MDAEWSPTPHTFTVAHLSKAPLPNDLQEIEVSDRGCLLLCPAQVHVSLSPRVLIRSPPGLRGLINGLLIVDRQCCSLIIKREELPGWLEVQYPRDLGRDTVEPR